MFASLFPVLLFVVSPGEDAGALPHAAATAGARARGWMCAYGLAEACALAVTAVPVPRVLVVAGIIARRRAAAGTG
jgi:hypothetical protein